MSEEAEDRAARRAARKEKKQRREFPETMEILDAIRARLIEALVTSKMDETKVRENLYYAVQTIDAMKGEMETVLASGSDAIEAYVNKIAAGGADGE